MTEAIKNLTETIKSLQDQKRNVTYDEKVDGRSTRAISCQCMATQNKNIHDRKTVYNHGNTARISSGSDKSSSSSESDSATSGSDSVTSNSSQEDYLIMANSDTYHR